MLMVTVPETQSKQRFEVGMLNISVGDWRQDDVKANTGGDLGVQESRWSSRELWEPDPIGPG